jgi:hypothetical protein
MFDLLMLVGFEVGLLLFKILVLFETFFPFPDDTTIIVYGISS